MAKARSGFATIASCLAALSLSIAPALALEQNALKNEGLPVGQTTDLGDDDAGKMPVTTPIVDENLSKKELKRRAKEAKDKEKEQEKDAKEKEKDAKEKQKEQDKAAKERQKTEAKAQKEAAPAKPAALPAGASAAGAAKPAANSVSTPTAVAPGTAPPVVMTSLRPPMGNLTGDAPMLLPDTALVSILKDVARTLKQDDGANSKDPNQKTVLAAAQQILEKAVQLPNIASDRIVRQSELGADKLTAEAWASGEVTLSDGAKGSLSAVWAKRENGLVSLSIAGDSDRKAPSGRPIGQFIVIVTGRSAIDKGFDIQSQAEVQFWICKVGNVAIESTCNAPVAEGAAGTVSGAEEAAKKKSELPVLQTVITERSRQYLAKLQAFRARQNALDPPRGVAPRQESAPEKVSAPEKISFPEKVGAPKEETAASPAKESEMAKVAIAQAAQPVPAESAAEDLPLRPMIQAAPTSSAEASQSRTAAEVNTPAPAVSNEQEPTRLAPNPTGKTWDETVKAVAPSAAQTVTTANTNPEQTGTVKPVSQPSVKPAETIAPAKPVSVAALSTQLSPANSSRGWESPAQPDGTKPPTLGATLVVPERAIAGQFLTAAVIDSEGNAEPLVELSFNGSPSSTDKNGQVSYMVPEDATPGHSLNIALAQRPELSPTTVDVLQTLTVQTQKDAPAIDTIAPMPGTARVAVIDGHNFDGFAQHNRVLIDGSTQARVLSASPVQLKVELPESVQPGPRRINVDVDDVHSNAGTLQYAVVQVRPDVKEAKKGQLTKLYVSVVGTTERKQLHITNQTPLVIKLVKGDDMRATTSGGDNNSVTLAVERLRAGNYKVTARIK